MAGRDTALPSTILAVGARFLLASSVSDQEEQLPELCWSPVGFDSVAEAGSFWENGLFVLFAPGAYACQKATPRENDPDGTPRVAISSGCCEWP